MAKLNELVYDIREAVNQFTDDSEIDDRYIIFLYNTNRALFLRQDLNNLQRTPDTSILQQLCVKMKEVSVNECGLDYDCGTILRTVTPIPKVLDLHLKSALTEVKPTNKLSAPFNFVNKNRALISVYSMFNKTIFAFLDADNHIYLISKTPSVKLIECISITGVFENPLDLANYTTCCGCETSQSCYDEMTSEYPLSSHYIKSIRDEVIKTLIGKLKTPEDKSNDADSN